MKTKKQLTYWLSVIVIGIALGLGLQFVRAWTEPTVAPPNGNVGAPVNTSAMAQTKSGGLNVMGSLGIGTESPANKLDVAGKVKATEDICTTVTGSEICLSTVSGTPGPPGSDTVTCPCGTCSSTSSGVPGVCLVFIGGDVGFAPSPRYPILLCTPDGWVCMSGCSC